MEPLSAESPTVAPFSIEKVRASFPALEREVNGKPVAYLDSGASAQRVLASIQAVDRYERDHHSNVHRGSHTLSAEATAAFEGARATRLIASVALRTKTTSRRSPAPMWSATVARAPS